MVSVEGEMVPLVSRIRPAGANGAVERWLVQVRRKGWGVDVAERWLGPILSY